VVNNGAREIQILFSSSGGAVDEGFSLYNFLRALPVRLTMHCIGYADSIAIAVFLAGEQRFCCPDSTFMFHDFGWASQAAVSFPRLQFAEYHASLDQSRLRSQQLLKSRARFSDEDFETLDLYSKMATYDAMFAKAKGIVHDIKEALIPTGTPIYNIDF
jgi:ATP-dependent protease ClpP protease subunit